MVNNPRPSPYSIISSAHPAYQILMTLLYFDVFSYPLSFDEILDYHHTPEANRESIQNCLDDLVAKGLVVETDGYYQLHQLPQRLIERKANNQRAKSYLKKARMMTKLIAQFPYTRAVFISGSLSKHVMAEDGDIDYFIITKPGRLWVTRTFLVLFKKIFLLKLPLMKVKIKVSEEK